MLLARTVATGMLFALIPMEALALPLKPTEAAVWSNARFRVWFLDVGMVWESQFFIVS